MDLNSTVSTLSSYHPELIGVSRIQIKSKHEIEAEYYVCKRLCDDYEPKIFEKLESQQWESTDVIEINFRHVPCHRDFFKLLKDGTCQISLEKSRKFQETCEYFGAINLANNVKAHFGGESIIPHTGNNLNYLRIYFFYPLDSLRFIRIIFRIIVTCCRRLFSDSSGVV